MKQLTEAQLRELLETAYIKGWDDCDRGVLDQEYLEQKKAAIDAMMEDL